MSNRITEKDLQNLCDELNKAKGFAMECYSKRPDGSHKPNPGVFHIDNAYGGVRLAQMSMKEGCTGTSDVPGVYGRGTKRELYEKMYAYLAGMTA
jgi:hypothetical protein